MTKRKTPSQQYKWLLSTFKAEFFKANNKMTTDEKLDLVRAYGLKVSMKEEDIKAHAQYVFDLIRYSKNANAKNSKQEKKEEGGAGEVQPIDYKLLYKQEQMKVRDLKRELKRLKQAGKYKGKYSKLKKQDLQEELLKVKQDDEDKKAQEVIKTKKANDYLKSEAYSEDLEDLEEMMTAYTERDTKQGQQEAIDSINTILKKISLITDLPEELQQYRDLKVRDTKKKKKQKVKIIKKTPPPPPPTPEESEDEYTDDEEEEEVKDERPTAQQITPLNQEDNTFYFMGNEYEVEPREQDYFLKVVSNIQSLAKVLREKDDYGLTKAEIKYNKNTIKNKLGILENIATSNKRFKSIVSTENLKTIKGVYNGASSL